MTSYRNLLLKKRNIRLGLLSGLSVMFFVVTVALSAQVFWKLGDQTIERTENVAWMTAKLESDHLKFSAALREITADDPISVMEAQRWFNVLLNREDVLLNSNVYPEAPNRLKAGSAFALLRDLIAQSDVLINRPAAQVSDSKPSLIALSDQMTGPIEELTRLGLDAYAAARETERHLLVSKLAQLTFLSIALLLAMLSLSVLLWQLYRRYRNRALENRKVLNRLSTIVDTSQDAVLVVGSDGEILDTNRASKGMFFDSQLPSRQITIDRLLMRRDAQGSWVRLTAEALLASCADGPSLSDSVMVRKPDGQRVPVELSADRAERGGNPVVICFIRNITRRLADQADLLAARDEALSGEKAKARFLGMVSHEMRTPLNGLLGTLDLMEDTELNADQARYVQIMQNSGQMLLAQINDALDITQAAQGGLTLEEEPFDLDALVAGLVRSQTLSAAARGNRFGYLAPKAPLGTVIGDPRRVHQVLLNLVTNANKFTEAGHITLKMSRGDGDIVVFQITDNGIGIDPADHNRIFEDFVRLDAARMQSVEGSGLGLGIARHLVGLMRGQIGVESVPQQGSAFWVHLPLAPVIEITQDVAPTPAPLPDTPLNVLVVEDNATNRMVLSEMLYQGGHRVWEAANGAQGVRLAATQRFDLIIMDLTMPVMDGTEAARRIRLENGPSHRARMIALSAHFTNTRGDAGPFDMMLTKPLRRAMLHEVLAGCSPKPAQEDPVAALDLPHLEEMRALLTPGQFMRLRDGFLNEGETVMQNLEHDAAHDPKALAKRVHQLAGLAGTIGARRFHSALSAAQTALETEDGAVPDALKALPALWAQTKAHLATVRDRA